MISAAGYETANGDPGDWQIVDSARAGPRGHVEATSEIMAGCNEHEQQLETGAEDTNMMCPEKLTENKAILCAIQKYQAVTHQSGEETLDSASTTSTLTTLCDADVDFDGGEEIDEDEQQVLLEDHLARQLSQYSASQIVSAWAKIYEHLAPSSDAERRTAFHSSRVPNISVADYFARMSQYFQCSDSCLILGPLLIDRLVKMHPEFELCKMSIHRLLATSVMVAAKYHDDVYYSNNYYAKVAGIPVKEMNRLEAGFLRKIGWRLQVSPEDFETYLHTVFPSVV